ncbi:hypothetical protein [Kitasatospora sp. LaBMicrA B282]|uniref:hypothetical protein n=1 Tax=Kitasatospora sp. LaBMicrA B282 TaxID=3420949 RepID=UPI003D0E374B
MNDEFSTSLEEELATLSPPPLGDLVGQAARRGRRIRRVRMIGGAAASVAAVATVAALLGTLGSGPQHTADLAGAAAALSTAPTPLPGDPPPPSAAPDPGGAAVASPSASPSSSAGPSANPSTTPAPTGLAPGSPPPSRSGADLPSTHPVPPPTGGAITTAPLPTPSAGGTVPTTPDGLVAEVVAALPGRPATGPYAAVGRDANGQASAQVYLNDSRGTSMVRVFLTSGALDCSSGCGTDGRGQPYQVSHESGNCIQSTVVTTQHPDGSLVTVQLSTCLAWNGSQNPASFEALSQDQAVQLAGDPSIGILEPAAQAARAGTEYGSLPTFH